MPKDLVGPKEGQKIPNVVLGPGLCPGWLSSAGSLGTAPPLDLGCMEMQRAFRGSSTVSHAHLN
jgi:hypothetical protein